MTSPCIPSGVFAPVATIFGDDGELDLDGFEFNLSYYATSALDGVVILGSNGEYALLETEEKLRLIEAGVRAIDGRKVVMAGTGTESTKGTIELTKRAAGLGIDYALVVTPYYYKPRYDHAAYLNHFKAVADASPVPILIYVMAAYTGVDLASSLVTELSGYPNIAGIKDSGGNAPKVGEMIAGAAGGFAVLAGSANFLYPALCLGATGGILALGDVAPDACKRLYSLWQAGDHDAARRLQLDLLAANAAVTTKHGIPGLKTALDTVGLKGGAPRAPLRPLSNDQADDVRATLPRPGLAVLSENAILTNQREFAAPLTIGVLSDTHIYPHGERRLPPEVLALFRRFDCGLILHAGDCNTVESVKPLTMIAPLLVVVGNNDRGALLEIAPREVTFTVGSTRVALLHGNGGQSARSEAKARFGGKVDLVVYGHSHVPMIEQADGTIFFNPGSPTDRRWSAHFGIGIITIVDGKIDPELILFNRPDELATVDPR